MAEANPPQNQTVPMSALANLAVEWWRLSAAPGVAAAGPARHALRKMEDFLKSCELEAQSMDGRAFDAGLAARVVDTIDDPNMPMGRTVIEQTISPIVYWRGQVIRPAEIVTRRGTGRGK
jgi:hypothetical protein